MRKCPICKRKTFDYVSYSEGMWGTVEQHGYCDSCGFMIEQAYSPVCTAFCDVTKGYRLSNGKYIEKNAKRHRRNRRKAGSKAKGYEINPMWVNYI